MPRSPCAAGPQGTWSALWGSQGRGRLLVRRRVPIRGPCTRCAQELVDGSTSLVDEFAGDVEELAVLHGREPDEEAECPVGVEFEALFHDADGLPNHGTSSHSDAELVDVLRGGGGPHSDGVRRRQTLVLSSSPARSADHTSRGPPRASGRPEAAASACPRLRGWLDCLPPMRPLRLAMPMSERISTPACRPGKSSDRPSAFSWSARR